VQLRAERDDFRRIKKEQKWGEMADSPNSREAFNYPYVVWKDYGYEGWDPQGFESLEEAQREMEYASSSQSTAYGAVIMQPIRCGFADRDDCGRSLPGSDPSA